MRELTKGSAHRRLAQLFSIHSIASPTGNWDVRILSHLAWGY